MNDRFGHAAGDEVLIEVAQHLQASVRLTDLAARYGGEEFAAILPETEAASAYGWAERLAEIMAQSRWKYHAVTVSIGIAELAEDVADMAELVARADQALYTAKREGRARAIVYRAEPA